MTDPATVADDLRDLADKLQARDYPNPNDAHEAVVLARRMGWFADRIDPPTKEKTA